MNKEELLALYGKSGKVSQRGQHFSWSSEDFEICQRKRAGRTGELQRYRGMDELVDSGAGAMFNVVRRLGLR